MYLRAHVTPPKGLINGQSNDSVSNVEVPSILETPEWVTPTNIEATIIKDKFVPAAQLCAGSFAADCTKYGIH